MSKKKILFNEYWLSIVLIQCRLGALIIVEWTLGSFCGSHFLWCHICLRLNIKAVLAVTKCISYPFMLFVYSFYNILILVDVCLYLTFCTYFVAVNLFWLTSKEFYKCIFNPRRISLFEFIADQYLSEEKYTVTERCENRKGSMWTKVTR